MPYQINNSELYHYGVLGMKWGVRNAETKAKYKRSKEIAGELNRLDKERAILLGKQVNAQGANRKFAEKYNKVLAKSKAHPNSSRLAKKAIKLGIKVNEAADQADSYKKQIKDKQKAAEKLGREVAKKHLTIRVTRVTRSTMTRGEKAANAAMVMLQYMTPSPVIFYRNPRTSGLKFKAQKQKQAKLRKTQGYLNGTTVTRE